MNYCPNCGHCLKEKEETKPDDELIEELIKDPELKKLLIETIL